MTSILKVSEIQDPTNGNSALTVDTSGRIFTPARPLFMAPGNASGYQNTSASNTIISAWNTSDSTISIVQGVMSFNS